MNIFRNSFYALETFNFHNNHKLLCSLSSSSNNNINNDVETIYRLITSRTQSETDLKQALKSTKILLSNDIIDKVLKRVRFSHANPLPALHLFIVTNSRRGFYHSSFSLDTMLYVLGRARMFNHIWPLLVEMKRKDPNIITCRTVQVVLARVAKVCSVRQTVESFKKFKKIVNEFDTNCFNALLRTLCQEKSMTDARNVYHSLKNSFSPNLHTFNILLSGWKSSEEAEGFFKEMKEMGVKPDVVSYNCLIDVYCKSREIEKARRVFGEMRDGGGDISPDVISYTSMIGGLGLAGQPDKARELLKEMREYGCYPDVAAYNAVIRNYCIAKRLGDGFNLMEEMVQKGLSPNATTYNVFMRSLFWSNDLRSAWSMYQRMKETGCLPNTQTCMFLIRLFQRHEKVDMALELWNDMVVKGFGAYTLVSDVLFDLLCDMGKLDEAEKCFLEMVDKGQKPSNVSFRRIKVLMELANKHDRVEYLSNNMAVFGPVTRLNVRVESSPERQSPDLPPC